jgi:hypothetical protein
VNQCELLEDKAAQYDGDDTEADEPRPWQAVPLRVGLTEEDEPGIHKQKCRSVPSQGIDTKYAEGMQGLVGNTVGGQPIKWPSQQSSQSASGDEGQTGLVGNSVGRRPIKWPSSQSRQLASGDGEQTGLVGDTVGGRPIKWPSSPSRQLASGDEEQTGLVGDTVGG